MAAAPVQPLKGPVLSATERIIFILDFDEEVATERFQPRAPNEPALLKIHCLRDAIRMFVHSKSCMNPTHQYGLIAMRNNAKWLADPAEGAERLIQKLSLWQPDGKYDVCDVGSAFALLQQYLPTNDTMLARLIFIYGRSGVKPTIAGLSAAYPILTSKMCVFDGIYVHKPTKESKTVQEVYDATTAIDDGRHVGYFFEVSTNRTVLFRCMAALLPHAAQRMSQDKQQPVLLT